MCVLIYFFWVYRGVDKNSENHGEKKQESSTLTSGSVQGLGMGLPDLKIKKKGKQKVPEPKQESHVSEALDKLREQTREAVKGLESVTGPRPPIGGDFGGDAMMEDWVKQFEELAGSQVCVLHYISFSLCFSYLQCISRVLKFYYVQQLILCRVIAIVIC